MPERSRHYANGADKAGVVLMATIQASIGERCPRERGQVQEKRGRKRGDVVGHANIVSRGNYMREREKESRKSSKAASGRNSRGGQENLLSRCRRCH